MSCPFSEQPDEALRVEVVRDVDGLNRLRAAWLAMAPHPNAHPDLVRDVVALREQVIRPHVVVLYRGARPIALLVGRIEREPFVCKLGYHRLWSRPTRWLTLVYGGALAAEAGIDWAPLVRSVLESLRGGEARVAAFRMLRLDGSLAKLVQTLPPPRCRDPIVVPETHWRLDLPGTLEELMRRERGKRRKELRRYRKVLEREHAGRVAYRRMNQVSDVRELCQRAESIGRRTYHRGLGAGFVHDLLTERRLTRIAAIGALRGYVLEIDAEPVAFWMGEVHGNVLYLHFTGFDAEYRKHDVGTVLLLVLLDDAIGEGLDAADYGFGDAFYKKRFGARQWDEATVHVFAPCLAGQSLCLLRATMVRLSTWVEALARRLGVYARIKTAARHRISRRSVRSHPNRGDAE